MRVSPGLLTSVILWLFTSSTSARWISRAPTNAARLSAGLPPARPRALFNASGTRAAPRALASPSPDGYTYGYIHLYDPNGAFVGHLFGGTPSTDPVYATRFRFVPPSDPAQPFSMAMVYEPTWTRYFAVTSYSADSHFGPGDASEGVIGAREEYPPYAPPNPPQYGSETSLWVIDRVTDAARLQWTNHDGSQAVLHFVKVTYPAYPTDIRYYVTGDVQALRAAGAAYSNVVEFTMKYSRTLEPQL